jgi:murein DD-endopeptidase MepM/ murein hydrolase activator NlpD
MVLGTTAETREEYIKWVDFTVSYEALCAAYEWDVDTAVTEHPVDWVELLAYTAAKTGGEFDKSAMKTLGQAAEKLAAGEETMGELTQDMKYYPYYLEAYSAVLGGMVGEFEEEAEDENGQVTFQKRYGLKAFFPLAKGFGYNHYDDFGAGRNYGYKRKHLGHDMMGSLGTPIVAVEGGIVEALGWNRYGGWRIGIRSFDGKRYYYYAHLQKDRPFAPGLAEGDMVQAGDLIGFMGRTGYSDKENTNNIETVHLHFGMQLIFDESQKECLSEIWIDVYDIVRLLNDHRSSVRITAAGWQRMYPYEDLDVEELQPKK